MCVRVFLGHDVANRVKAQRTKAAVTRRDAVCDYVSIIIPACDSTGLFASERGELPLFLPFFVFSVTSTSLVFLFFVHRQMRVCVWLSVGGCSILVTALLMLFRHSSLFSPHLHPLLPSSTSALSLSLLHTKTPTRRVHTRAHVPQADEQNRHTPPSLSYTTAGSVSVLH
jgi:hypothetical protein